MFSTNNNDETARRGTWSVALRLTAWYVSSSFVILLVATVALYLMLDGNLQREQDQFLADKLRVIRMMLQQRPEEIWQLKEEVEQTWAPRQYARVYVRVVDSGGDEIAASPEMQAVLGTGAFPPPVARDVEPDAGVSLRSVSGKPMRVMAGQAQIGGAGDDAVVQVALDTELAGNLLAGYRRTLFLTLGAGLAVCAVTGYWLARIGLRPLRQIAATAQRIRSSNLDERIEVVGLPAELSVLAARFNAMLGRLQDSFDRLSRFSADIAHELRTPVNNMRLEVEVALGKARSTDEYRDTLGSFLEECQRLSRIIDSMLFIARAEDPRTQIVRESVDVRREMERVAEFYEAPAVDAGIELSIACAPEMRAPLDRTLFQRAVGNLVANAIRYTPRGGRVRITAARDNGQLRIDVSDTGMGIPPDDLPRVFDRFYRADRARSTANGNVGLGLAIVKSIVTLHGGTIAADSAPGRGTRMSINLPVDHLATDSRKPAHPAPA